MLEDFLVPFVTIGLAELGDKTQLSVLLLASKTKEHFQLLLGVMLAFLLVDGFAIILGSWITNIVSMNVLKILSGGIFIIFGLLILLDKDAEREKYEVSARCPFISGFLLIFFAEWGDKTQLAAGVFAAKYNATMVLLGTLTALAILSLVAIYLGKFLSEKIDKRTISKIAGFLFIVIGLGFFLI